MFIQNVEETETITLRDLDVGLVTGEERGFTLYPSDLFTISESGIEIRYATTGEIVRIREPHIVWTSLRERQLEVKKDRSKG